MSMGSLDSGWVGLAGAPGQAGREEHGAVAEGLAGEADAGVRGDLLAGLLEISGGAEDPPGGGLPHFGDGKEEADGALAEVLGELYAEVLVPLGAAGGRASGAGEGVAGTGMGGPLLTPTRTRSGSLVEVKRVEPA